MEVLGNGNVLNVAGKVARTKLWKAKMNEETKELTKKIINTKGIKHWQERDTNTKLKPEWKEQIKAPTHLTRQEGRPDLVMSKVLNLFQQAMSICSLEAELIFRDYSICVKTSGGSAKLARCRLILNAEKGKIKFKIHKSAALAVLVPGAVTKAVYALNTALSCLPFQNTTSIIKRFNSIFKVFTSGNICDDVIAQNDVSDGAMSQNDVIDDHISMEQVLSETNLTAPSKLFSTLLAVDVKMICPRDVVVEFKKKQMLATLRRQTVVLDTKQGLQIIKEPRAILRGQKVQTTMAALALWISSCSQFNAWQNTFEVVKCLQITCPSMH